RTLGVVLFQDQVNQLAIDVAGFAPGEADRLRRAFGRKHNTELIEQYRQRFLAGAAQKGIGENSAEKVFSKFNGLYMFPESHAFAFGVTAYQAAWLKRYYPLEFFVAIFNQQPMGFYNLETLKEDAKRHGVGVLNPDINKSKAKCTIENGSLRLGFLHVTGLGGAVAIAIEVGRKRQGVFIGIGSFLERSGALEEVAVNLAGAGAFDSLEPNRRKVKWEIGLRYRPVNAQLSLDLPVAQDGVELAAPSGWEKMQEEYTTLSLFPGGHVMAGLRHRFKDLHTSRDVAGLSDGATVTAAGLVIRRQRPHGKVVFLTLEDEFGHIPCMVFGQVYQQHEHTFRSAFLVVSGRLTWREGACNVVISGVRSFRALEKVPGSKDWR
ncbi:OB-fold nucleic acid binding domain-containing protein, partial [Chloroflexota bacterium]